MGSLHDAHPPGASGPAMVGSSMARYTYTAWFDDGGDLDVTAGAAWLDNSQAANISGCGWLTAGAVTADQVCQITAALGGKAATLDVTIEGSKVGEWRAQPAAVIELSWTGCDSTWKEICSCTKFATPSPAIRAVARDWRMHDAGSYRRDTQSQQSPAIQQHKNSCAVECSNY